jgi:replicative DNA helicase
MERIEQNEAIAKGEVSARVDFPWQAIRRYVTYLRPGMLALVVAGSGVGKTTFMECCAEHWARQGLSVAFFHLELGHQFMMDRRMCRQSGIPLAVVENGEILPEMREATDAMRLWPGGIHYVHCPGWSALRVAAKIHQLRAKGLCDVAIVDYLQKMRAVYEHGQNTAQARGEQCEAIKTVAEQLGIPILMGSQFSRGAYDEQRKTARYIRDSGEPEEKANVIVTLDREILEQPITGPDGRGIANVGERSPEVRVRVDKNTGGKTGDFMMIMNGARFLMLDISGREEE